MSNYVSEVNLNRQGKKSAISGTTFILLWITNSLKIPLFPLFLLPLIKEKGIKVSHLHLLSSKRDWVTTYMTAMWALQLGWQLFLLWLILSYKVLLYSEIYAIVTSEDKRSQTVFCNVFWVLTLKHVYFPNHNFWG